MSDSGRSTPLTSAYGEKTPAADGEKTPAFLRPDQASFFAQVDAKLLSSSATATPEHTPCGLRYHDSDELIVDYANLPLKTREDYVAKIVSIMSNWKSDHKQPAPLVFIIEEGSGNITLHDPLFDVDAEDEKAELDDAKGEKPEPEDEKSFEAGNNRQPDSYLPHFWIPDSCLIGLKDEEKAFRREFFAVGCLIYQILKGEKVWDQFTGPQAQILFGKGVYPSDVKEMAYWRIILSYWSWEYVVEVNKRLKAKLVSGIFKKVAIGGVALGGSIALLAALSPVILPAIGFGSAGVGAGTVAAGWQSAIGLVEAGSIFAICQSAGAGGAMGAAAITAAGLTGTGVVVGAGAAAGAAAGIESNILRDEDLFALFLQKVRKAPGEI